ncbi:MAG: hypothetical protein IMF14_00750 [Proteobacteria bacterium]|nr:hypothetical protein [Pseudomonadota bacterium]
MTEKKTTDTVSDKTPAKASAKKAAAKPADKTVEKKTVKAATGTGAKKESTATPKAKAVPIKGAAVIEKAAASKESDLKSAAIKISELDKKTADDAIKSKKSREDLKARAHEAKQRAQQKILDKSFVSDKPTDPLERLANTFDSSAKRWEMVVYPSLFAFVLLAGYGFFLIYRLTHDIATLSQSVTHMAVIVSDAMPRMTKDLNNMTGSIDSMTGNIDGMTGEIVSMSGQMESLTPMSNNIQSMTHNIGSMNRSVYGMQRDMHGMNRTVSSGPFGMMNDVMPFSSNTNVPSPVAPSPVWPSYNTYPQYQYAPRRPPVAVNKAPEHSTAVKTTETATKADKEVKMPGASPVSLKKPTEDSPK